MEQQRVSALDELEKVRTQLTNQMEEVRQKLTDEADQVRQNLNDAMQEVRNASQFSSNLFIFILKFYSNFCYRCDKKKIQKLKISKTQRSNLDNLQKPKSQKWIVLSKVSYSCHLSYNFRANNHNSFFGK